MLSIVDIRKEYTTGDLTQVALGGVTLNLRDSEFVAILGPSGSGKTTLLNIVGGLDHYDSGDLIINGVSTKKYADRDWDSYRNHSVGFVFQSYNLIPHQSILSNVELALTISGVSKKERRSRATEVLTQVGLGDQLHKRPTQLSGGQMQRVAIARALVNDPEVLLADEPTGALDTQTSTQIMDLLREVAKDRLVVMVTHNPELAEEYATRIVTLRDGQITSDSDPYLMDEADIAQARHKNLGKASMSFFTALSLSFNNLRTKKGRTILTSFAGSMGIIGIALILSLSSGVNTYIANIQKETMSSYPITIEAQAIDLTSMIAAGRSEVAETVDHDRTGVHSNSLGLETASSVTSSITENNLSAFKKYLETPGNGVEQFVGDNGIVYSYDVDFDVFSRDEAGTLVNADGSTFDDASDSSSGSLSALSNMPMGGASPAGTSGAAGASPFGGSSSTFQELIPSASGDPVGQLMTDNYEILEGAWPTRADEMVLVLDENNEVPLSVLYDLGMLPAADYQKILEQMDAGETPDFPSYSWTYDEVIGYQFQMLTRSDYFAKNDNGTFSEVTDQKGIEDLVDKEGTDLTIVGVIRPVEGTSDAPLTGSVGYTNLLTDQIINHTNDSAVVKAQNADPKTNVMTGLLFAPKDDDQKVTEMISYLKALSVSDKAALAQTIMAGDSNVAAGMAAMPTSEAEMADFLDSYLDNDPDRDTLLSLYDQLIPTATLEGNLSDFGVVSLDSPSSISIYTDSFDAKTGVTDAIDSYNATAGADNKITYTDYVGLLMSSITTIINVITYVLIAFVAVSLVVSSIMIGIITFISVLERTKEIGVLRAVGASKRNISAVFNAETIIVGLLAGLLGIGATLLLQLPINAVIHAVLDSTDVSAALPWQAGIALVVLSMLLTVVAGLIPARVAARKDPVAALRSE